MIKRLLRDVGRGGPRYDRPAARFRLPTIGFLAAAALAFSPALTAQHAGHMGMAPMTMTSALFPGLPMSREGSGTSWQPDSSPVFAWRLGSYRLFGLYAGAQASIYHVVDELAPAYGKRPFSFEVYLRMSPPRASGMGSMPD